MSDEIPMPEYTAHLEGALAIARELDRMTFEKRALKWFESHAPLVVKELQRQGVKFPKRRSKEL